MGIFTGSSGNRRSIFSSPTSTDPLQRTQTEIENKRSLLQQYGIPDPTINKPTRNAVERVLNTPENTGFLGDVLDLLSRGQYASANIARKLIDDEEDSALDILKAGGRGLTGEERSSYSDVLDDAGMAPSALRSALGFTGDVLLDPTTYLTLGYGAVAKAGGKATAKGLGKVIPKALGKEAIDRGGVKFAGLSLIPQTVVDKGLQKTGVTAGAEALRKTKPAQVLGKAFIPNFREADTAKDVWEGYVDLKKGYQNALDYGQNQALEEAIDLGKGLSKDERSIVTHAIQNPALMNRARVGAPKKVVGAVDRAKGIFEKSAKEEVDLGLLKGLRENYVPGIYPEKGKSFLEGLRYNPSIKATIGKHGKQKKFGTLQEAIDAGYKPETDIAKLVGAREVVSKRATTTQKFINDTLEKYGKKITVKNIDHLPDDMGVYLPKGNLRFFPQDVLDSGLADIIKNKTDDELIEVSADMIKKGVGITKNVPVYALPRQIAGDLNKFKKSAWDEGTKGLIKYGYDIPLNLWKAYATATNPGFHIRNALSNIFQTGLNNAGGAINPKTHIKAGGVALAKTPFVGKRIADWTIDVGGQKMTIKEARELMEKSGVINQGWFSKEIPDYIENQLTAGLKGKLSPNLINPLSQNNALIKSGRAIGRGVENQSRALSFLADMNRGLTQEQAAKNVEKFLFDYGDLTDFEKNVMRRLVPFYTWMRKNIPLQAEQMVKQPGKYAAIPKATKAIEENTPEADESFLPEYMQNWVRTPFTQSDNPLYWNPNLPYGDIEKLNPGELKKNAMSSLTPAARVPMELLPDRGYSYFFEQPIERYEGELKTAPGYTPNLPEPLMNLLGIREITDPETGETELKMPAKTRYALKQMPFLENVSRSIEYKDDKKLNHLLSFFLGAKIAPYDYEKGQTNNIYDQRNELRDLYDKLEADGLLPKNTGTTKKKGIFQQ